MVFLFFMVYPWFPGPESRRMETTHSANSKDLVRAFHPHGADLILCRSNHPGVNNFL
jgi:hypothetical protein